MHVRVYFVEKENQSGSWPSKVAITALKHRTQSACHERLQKPPPLQHIPSTRLICTVPGLSPQLVCQFLAPVLLPTTVSRASCHLLSCSGTQTHQSSASLWHFTTIVSHLCPSPARALPGSQPPALAKLPVPHPAMHLRAWFPAFFHPFIKNGCWMKGFTQQTELRFRATNVRFHNTLPIKLKVTSPAARTRGWDHRFPKSKWKWHLKLFFSFS